MNITLALDWTPNTNHIGFYVALGAGWYADAGLHLRITSPHLDNYALSPARKVAAGLATFGLSPSESVISFQTLPARPRLVAVAAVLQRDTSAIVTLADSGRNRPALLDGCVYASYGARFEAAIVAEMIRNDGGQGIFVQVYPPKLGIWNTLVHGQADATWVCMPWEGIAAMQRGVRLNAFYLKNYQIPYGYSPVVVAHPYTLRNNPEMIRTFLAISARGYQYAVQQPQAAIDLLCKTAQHPALANRELLEASLDALQHAYLLPSGAWGQMDTERWQLFVAWLQSREVLTDVDGRSLGTLTLPVNRLFTNEFLPT